MQDQKNKELEKIISKLDDNRSWLLKNVDNNKWPELRFELAELERELSRFILRAREYNSEIINY